MAPKAEAGKTDAKPKAKGKAKEKKEDEGPKMDPPNREEFDKAVEKINEAIEGLQKEQAALATKISSRSGGGNEYFSQFEECKGQLNEFKNKIDELIAARDEIKKSIGDKRQEGVDMKNQLTKMQKTIGYTSEDQIDARINEIEYKLNFETITLRVEKELLKEITELKRKRPKLQQVNQMTESLQNRDTGSAMKGDLSTINEQIGLYLEGKKQVQEKLNALYKSRQDQRGDLPELIKQREEISKQISEKIAERNAARDEFKQKEREFQNWRNEQRKIRQEKWLEEKAQKQAEWEMSQRIKKAEQMDVQPYVAEITLIEQTITFCNSLTAVKGPAETAEKKAIDHSSNLPEGAEVLLKKDDREEEFYYAPTAKKKKGKSNKKGAGDGTGARPIKHNAETFRLFDQIKLQAPITTDDVPATLEKLNELLTDYQNKVKKWELEKEELRAKILKGEEAEDEAEAQEGEAEDAKEKTED